MLFGCTPAPQGKQGNPFISILPLVLIFVVFYFLLIYPKSREQKKHQFLLSKLKKGDRVILSCGIHGKVVGVTDKIAVLRIAEDVKIEVEKGHIVTVIKD